MDEHLDKLAEKIEKKIIEKEQLEHRLQRAENRMEYLASKERKESIGKPFRERKRKKSEIKPIDIVG